MTLPARPQGGRVEFSALCPLKLRQRALRRPAIMPSVQRWTFNLAGADMGVITEETLALTVAEATMQDWLAALTQLERAPQGFLAPHAQPASHPVLRRPVPVRRPVVCTRHRTASVSVAPEQRASAVGGARSAYWVGLAAAPTALLVL